MRIQSRLKNLLIKTLSQSVDTKIMVRVIRILIHDYDINQRSGFPENIPVPTQDAAAQITQDVIEAGLFPHFISTLIDIHKNGLMGRKIQFNFLPQIIKELDNMGMKYNPSTGYFEERGNHQKTRGWGILHEGEMYEFSFLRIDVVGNTKLVRQYSHNLIQATYSDITGIIKRIVEKRNGRIWDWEGDGGYAAFHFKDKNIMAVLAGIEILYELFLYNLFFKKLPEPVSLRMAIHTGPCQFFEEIRDLKNDTLKRLEVLESKYSKPDSLTLSPGVYSDLGGKLEKAFKQIALSGGKYVYRYSLQWEE